MGYFQYIPTTTYFNSAVPNIMVRVKFSKDLLSNALIFHPYVIQEGDRADTIADLYYGDSELDWLIYLANNIIDPKNEWPLTQNEFNDHLTNSYGSPQIAQSTIGQYILNTDIENITNDIYFDIADNLKKYWSYNFTTSSWNIVNSVNWVVSVDTFNNLNEAEQYYWIPQTVYTQEFFLNETKRIIQLVDSDYAQQLKQTLQTLMQNE